MSCSRTQGNDAGEALTGGPAVSSQDPHMLQTLLCMFLFDLILTSSQQSFSYIGTGLPGLNQY